MTGDDLDPKYRAVLESGDAEKIHTIANLYYQGLTVKENKTVAAELYGKAADRGYVQSMLRLGIMYMYGDGIGQDYREAAKLLRKASDRGNADAGFLLATLYTDGKGVDRIPAEAAKLCHEAAMGGSHGAMVELAIWYRDGINYIQRDIQKCVAWLMKASLDGYPNAMYELGCMYAFGESVKKDEKNGRYLLMHAIEAGDSDAKKALDALDNGAGHRPE